MTTHSLPHSLPLSRRHVLRASSLTVAGLMALAACDSDAGGTTSDASPSSRASGGGGASDAGGAETDQGTWPRTVSVGRGEVTLETAPQRVVAVSTETGDITLELIGPGRVAGLPKTARDPHSSNHADLARSVEGDVVGAPHPEPEQILSLEPDLVLLTSRHGGEEDLGAVLETSGVPVAAFPASSFTSMEGVMEAITTLGELLGAEAKAAEVTAAMKERVDGITAQLADVREKPRTLGLMARGDSQMMFSAQSSGNQLITLAGGISIADELGWVSAPSADPEVLIAANPDVILVQDFRGKGMEPFTALLESPALAEVPAVANDRIYLISALHISGTAGSHLPEGLADVAAALHPDVLGAES